MRRFQFVAEAMLLIMAFAIIGLLFNQEPALVEINVSFTHAVSIVFGDAPAPADEP